MSRANPCPHCDKGSLLYTPDAGGWQCHQCARVTYDDALTATLAGLASLAARASAERGRTARTLGRSGPRMHREDGR